jgi:uncharacterized protein YbcC (UPF0753/DUF2309 family)
MKTTEIVNPTALQEAIDAACGKIAPTWPLDRFIAVNPYWGWVDRPFDEVADRLGWLSGTTMFMPREFYARAFREKRFELAHLRQALAEAGLEREESSALAGLDDQPMPTATFPLLSDILDTRRDLTREPAWRDTITHEISQFCGAYFDEDQADWHLVHDETLFAGWRETIRHDRGIALLMKAPEVAERVSRLPEDSREAIRFVLDRLAVPASEVPEFLTAVLLRVNGWAAWGAYLRWQARLEGGDNSDIVDVLAIRLAWEFLLDDGGRETGSVWAQWQSRLKASVRNPFETGPRWESVYQRALEIAYRTKLAAELAAVPAAKPSGSATPAVQAAFCIDVRSEVFRRAFEAVAPDVQTLGFAGFFGLPIEYAPLGTEFRRPQLPGLLAPAMCVTDTSGHAHGDQKTAAARENRLVQAKSKLPFKRMPGSAFALVETLGLGYATSLIGRSLAFGQKTPASPDHEGLGNGVRLRKVLSLGDDIETKINLAEKVLKAMGLTAGFARLVMLAGHGSTSANNPHAAGLDCGACCGQTGEVNARALAALLNEPSVRRGLVARNFSVPEDTFFLAALHNTTTDVIELYDTDLLPPTHADDLVKLREKLDAAGRRARAERAPALGLAELADRPEALFKSVKTRSADWSQTRPEWGLADNAAFIVAPRHRTKNINLGGRSFLHDYDWKADKDCSILELIMTAPMVVTNWINMQYYASTVDNRRYGSGNKVLHNVVGGRIGVFEGNGGDLRVGLSMQSLHDGEKWLHTPQRLAVFIEAPREGIEGVIRKHALVRQLIENEWLSLMRIDPERGDVEQYRADGWKLLAAA